MQERMPGVLLEKWALIEINVMSIHWAIVKKCTKENVAKKLLVMCWSHVQYFGRPKEFINEEVMLLVHEDNGPSFIKEK